MNKTFTIIILVVILILVTTNIYFITNYKKARFDVDKANIELSKVIEENKTLKVSLANPKIIYKEVYIEGKTQIVTKELIKVTTEYIEAYISTNVPVYGETIYYKETITTKEPSTKTIDEEKKPIVPGVEISTMSIVDNGSNKNKFSYNYMVELKSDKSLTIGAGISIKKYSMGINIDSNRNIGIYGIKMLGD